MRVFASLWLMFLLLILAGCGGTSSTPSSNGPLSGNWQINMVAAEPSGTTTLSAAGFIMESNDALGGSVQGPTTVSASGATSCGGVGPVSGTINGQNVSFSLNPGGTVFNFTGAISSDNSSMSGVFQAIPGACTAAGTTGTWNAVLIPPLNGNFTGTITSTYMEFLQGTSAPVPVTVSGSFTQSSNADGSNASLTGTINAVGYPCFTTALLTGTISGQNVYMDVFDYNGEQIGTLGVPPSSANGSGAAPATVVVNSTGVSLTGSGTGGLSLGNGSFNPCPALINTTGDSASVDFTF